MPESGMSVPAGRRGIVDTLDRAALRLRSAAMRRAIAAIVPASSNSASTGMATPKTAETAFSNCAPRNESPPSMKKSASAGTA